jgi:hypothetical protein
MALEREDGHAEWTNACRHRATDVAAANDSNGVARNRKDVKLLPDTGHLIANHAAKIFGEMEDGRESEFTQRCAEDADAVGESHRTFDKLREERTL